MKKLLILVTAHDPLSRFDPLLKCLKEYAQFPVQTTVVIYIDYEHMRDQEALRDLIEANVCEKLDIELVTAPANYKGYHLCWAHKNLLRLAVTQSTYDYYMYSENDMLFTLDNFNYWLENKDALKELNLEPSFCRYELNDDLKIPFDNYKRYNLTELTENVWHDIPHKAKVYLTPTHEKYLGFVLLGNPYSGMMILDQEMAEEYIASVSSHPELSHRMVGHRNWPIADRSSMGTAFENLEDGQDHRRVVPLVHTGDWVTIADEGLIRHLDTKYSGTLLKQADCITTENMFV
tara:strand:- start:307 stop:1179 length:873 start_codon:yes stop_codon:yes gene_type:complete